MKFWNELKRRKVFQVCGIYLVVAWLLVQVAIAIFPTLLLPEWSPRLVLAIAILGFPIAAILAWAQDTSASPHAKPAAIDATLPERPTLAVLPFSNISTDPEQEHFADSLTEDLITDLSKFKNLQVIARNSTFVYKNQAVDVRKAGEDLKADLILEGSLRKAKDVVRFTAQLINAKNGHHLWAERQDRQITDVLKAQDEICKSISQGVLAALAKDAKSDGKLEPSAVDGVSEAPGKQLGVLRQKNLLETKYARSGDFNIAYNDTGGGPFTVVTVPGVVSHLELDQQIMGRDKFSALFPEGTRIISFDKRGQGLSDPIIGAPALEERMDDLLAVMDAAGVKRAVIAAFSEGGPLSLLFTAAHPERVQGLIITGSTARFAEDIDYPGFQRSGIERSADHWGDGSLRKIFYPQVSEEVLSMDAYRTMERLIATPASMKAQFSMIAEIDVRHVLPAIHTPTLVIHFTGDRAVMSEHGKYLADHIKNADFLLIEADDHAMIGNYPEAIERVQSFVRDVQAHSVESDRILATVLTMNGGGLDEEKLREVSDEFSGHVTQNGKNGHRTLIFNGPSRAVKCAERIREVKADASIALHSGLVIMSGATASGPAVEKADALVEDVPPAEIIVTGDLNDLLVQSGIELTQTSLAGHENERLYRKA